MKKLALLMAILMMVCASASAVTASDENVYPIADEVVTLTVWTGNVANRDYVNCDMTKFIEEKLGVKINFQFYTDDANTAYKKAMGHYGRFDNAPKYIDPRQE